MSILLDIIIIAIIALTVYFAAKNGFVKTAISAISFILAIAITAMFAPTLAESFKETSIADTVRETTEDKIEEMLTSSSEGIYGLLDGENEDFNALVRIAGLELEDLKSWYIESAVNVEARESMLARRIATPIIDVIATLLAIIVLFIATQIVLAIVACILDKVARLPILRTANKALGILLGVLLAFFRVLLFCFVVDLLIRHAPFIDSSFIDMLDPESTLLYAFFSKIDVFSFFI